MTGLAKLVADELGITAGLECFTTGDLGACGEIALNVALMFVGGLPGKIAAKYGLRWRKATELGRKIARLGGDLVDGIKDRIKANRKLDNMSCPIENSFVPGTRVVIADGPTTPIEDVQIDATVVAADPETEETGPGFEDEQANPPGAVVVGDGVIATDNHSSGAPNSTNGSPPSTWRRDVVADLGGHAGAGFRGAGRDGPRRCRRGPRQARSGSNGAPGQVRDQPSPAVGRVDGRQAAFDGAGHHGLLGDLGDQLDDGHQVHRLFGEITRPHTRSVPKVWRSTCGPNASPSSAGLIPAASPSTHHLFSARGERDPPSWLRTGGLETDRPSPSQERFERGAGLGADTPAPACPNLRGRRSHPYALTLPGPCQGQAPEGGRARVPAGP